MFVSVLTATKRQSETSRRQSETSRFCFEDLGDL